MCIWREREKEENSGLDESLALKVMFSTLSQLISVVIHSSTWDRQTDMQTDRQTDGQTDSGKMFPTHACKYVRTYVQTDSPGIFLL